MNAMLDSLAAQNPIMLVLFTLSVICGAAAIDRMLFWISSALKYAPLPLGASCRESCAHNLLIERLSVKKSRHYTEEVLFAAMQTPTNCDRVAQTASEQLDLMAARLGVLDLIARVAPLVGILGTVVGMALSFGSIGAIINASPAAISNGISVALSTTAYGLVISIAASVTAAVFRKCIKRATLKIGRIICEVQSEQKLDPARR